MRGVFVGAREVVLIEVVLKRMGIFNETDEYKKFNNKIVKRITHLIRS